MSPKFSPCFPLCLSHFSAAKWSQALLYRIKKAPLHHQEHEGHLSRFHGEAGLYSKLITINANLSSIAIRLGYCSLVVTFSS